jgi:hypothetical protein
MKILENAGYEKFCVDKQRLKRDGITIHSWSKDFDDDGNNNIIIDQHRKKGKATHYTVSFWFGNRKIEQDPKVTLDKEYLTDIKNLYISLK